MADELKMDTRVFQIAPVNRKAQDHKTVYTNVIRAGITPFDFRIVFGQVADPIPDSPAQQSEDQVTVIMAPEEAKALIPIILQALQRYEGMFGKIRDVTSRLAKMKAEALAKKVPATMDAPIKTETSRKSKKN